MLASLPAWLLLARKPAGAPSPTTFLRPPRSCWSSSAGEAPRRNSVPNLVAVLTCQALWRIGFPRRLPLLEPRGDQRVPPIDEL